MQLLNRDRVMIDTVQYSDVMCLGHTGSNVLSLCLRLPHQLQPGWRQLLLRLLLLPVRCLLLPSRRPPLRRLLLLLLHLRELLLLLLLRLPLGGRLLGHILQAGRQRGEPIGSAAC